MNSWILMCRPYYILNIVSSQSPSIVDVVSHLPGEPTTFSAISPSISPLNCDYFISFKWLAHNKSLLLLLLWAVGFRCGPSQSPASVCLIFNCVISSCRWIDLLSSCLPLPTADISSVPALSEPSHSDLDASMSETCCARLLDTFLSCSVLG